MLRTSVCRGATIKKAMSSADPENQDQGITLRHAALIAGLGLLMMAILAPFAEFFVYPKLVLRGNVEETVLNIRAKSGLFLAGLSLTWSPTSLM